MLFLLFAVFSSFFTIPVEIENARLKLVLVILTGAPMTNSNDAIEMLPVVTDRTIIKTVKRSKRFTKTFANQFSFFNFSDRIIFAFIDFIQPKAVDGLVELHSNLDTQQVFHENHIQPFLNISHEIVEIIIFKTLFGEKRIVKSVKVFSANTKSINPMQKYPHIIE